MQVFPVKKDQVAQEQAGDEQDHNSKQGYDLFSQHCRYYKYYSRFLTISALLCHSQAHSQINYQSIPIHHLACQFYSQYVLVLIRLSDNSAFQLICGLPFPSASICFCSRLQAPVALGVRLNSFFIIFILIDCIYSGLGSFLIATLSSICKSDSKFTREKLLCLNVRQESDYRFASRQMSLWIEQTPIRRRLSKRATKSISVLYSGPSICSFFRSSQVIITSLVCLNFLRINSRSLVGNRSSTDQQGRFFSRGSGFSRATANKSFFSQNLMMLSQIFIFLSECTKVYSVCQMISIEFKVVFLYKCMNQDLQSEMISFRFKVIFLNNPSESWSQIFSSFIFSIIHMLFYNSSKNFRTIRLILLIIASPLRLQLSSIFLSTISSRLLSPKMYFSRIYYNYLWLKIEFFCIHSFQLNDYI